MASQVLQWTIKLVKKLKTNRKPKSKQKKVTPLREASISRPSLRKPSEAYSQRKTEVEPLPYPWTEIDHGRRSVQNGTTTHYYPHIYFQDGQYHTVRWPPLSSSPTPPSRANSPVSIHSGLPKAVQRSLTYPAGSPHSGRAEVWWAGANHPRMHSPQPQHPWYNRASSPHPGGGSDRFSPCPIVEEPHKSASPPPLPKNPIPSSRNVFQQEATPGTSRIPLQKAATPGPSRLPDIEPVRVATAHTQVEPIADEPLVKKRKGRNKVPEKHKTKSKQKPPVAPRNPLDFPRGVTPPAVQQLFQMEDQEEERKRNEFKPTAQFSAHDGFWLRQFIVDPRDPPPDFPYEKYLEMKRAEHERERRHRKREQEQEEKRQASDLRNAPESRTSSRWTVSWIHKFFRSKRSTSLGGRR